MLQLLGSMDLFINLAPNDLLTVAGQLKTRNVSEGHAVFRQGEPGRGLYVVVEGRVRISAVDHAGRERALAFCGPGEFFGEMAVLTGEPRSATASAATNVRLLELHKEDFHAIAAANSAMTRGMLRVMVERQTSMNRRLTQEVGGLHGDIRGYLTVVFSLNGGAGKTVVATNLAVALAQLTPDRVLILDLDLLFGHVPLLLDLLPQTSLAAISPAAIRAFDADNLAHYYMTHLGSSLRVMAGALRAEDADTISAEHVAAIVEVLRRQFVHIVVDAGSHFSEACLAALERADEIIVVTTPASIAMDAAQEAQRVLSEVLNVPAKRIRFVQNQPTPYGEMCRAALATRLRTERVSEIPFGGQEVTQATLNGLPLVMNNTGNIASRAIVALAHTLEESASELVALSAR